MLVNLVEKIAKLENEIPIIIPYKNKIINSCSIRNNLSKFKSWKIVFIDKINIRKIIKK